MPTYFARKAGNINAADVWATTPSGTAADVFSTFTNADILMANSFAITINVNTTVAEVRNDTTGGATANGSFTLANNVTLSASVFAHGVTCVSFWGTTGSVVAVNIRGGNAFNSHGVNNAGTGTLNVTVSGVASCQGGGTWSGAVQNGSSGTLDFTGNATGGSGGNHAGVMNRTSGTVKFTGTATGGTFNSVGNAGIFNANDGGGNAGTINVFGTVIGGSALNTFGLQHNAASGAVTITGNATGGTAAPGLGLGGAITAILNGSAIASSTTSGVLNSGAGTVRIKRIVGNAFGPGNTSGLTSQAGASNTGTGIIEFEELEYGSFGQTPTSGSGFRFRKVNTNVAVFNYCDTAGAKTLIDATQNAAMPAATDVRSGVSYASGAQTGSCAVPAAGSVALGVPVDAGFGTAVLTPAAIRSELSVELGRIDTAISSRLAPSGTLATVTTLTNAPASVTPAQIRAEMDANSTKLANLDATVSSRLATSGYTAPSAVPTAAQNATAVWGAATKEITGGTVTTLTNAPSVPSAASIRAEIDSNSTQLAAIKSKTDNLPASPAATGDIPSANITAIKAKTDALPASPAATGDIPSANISAIKAKTDLLNTDRLAQCSTVSTTGAQLAAALS